MSYDYDAIIIGAGTSGLAAGSALQKAGKIPACDTHTPLSFLLIISYD